MKPLKHFVWLIIIMVLVNSQCATRRTIKGPDIDQIKKNLKEMKKGLALYEKQVFASMTALREARELVKDQMIKNESNIEKMASLKKYITLKENQVLSLNSTIADIETKIENSNFSSKKIIENLKQQYDEKIQMEENNFTNFKLNREIENSYKYAKLKFNPPTKMKVGEKIKVFLLLSITENESELKAKIIKLSDKGKISEKEQIILEEKIKIYSQVIADLSCLGGGIKVTSSKPDKEPKAITEDKIYKWAWNLKAEKAGEYDLVLKIYHKYQKANKDLKEYEFPTKVIITPKIIVKSFLAKYWQWLMSVFLIPLTIFLTKKWITYQDRKCEEKIEKKKDEDDQTQYTS